jgi:hypothetical protein
VYAQQSADEAPAVDAAAAAPAKPYPCPDRPGDDQKEIVGARFLQAWICRTSNKYWNPSRSRSFRCWKEPYTRIPEVTGCKDNQLTFKIPPDLTDPNVPPRPDACAEQCANELNKQFDCYASVYEKTDLKPDLDKYRNQCNWEHDPNFVTRFGIGNAGPANPFNLVPDYCRKSTRPRPASGFGPVVPGDNVYLACDCLLTRADCSGTETACARSAAACHKLGGSARPSCYVEGGGCTPTVNLTDKECAYRDPEEPCEPPICHISLRPGDACDPVTGEAGEGGTCQIYGGDRFHCVRPRPPVIDVVQADTSPLCLADATSATAGAGAPR